MLLFQVKGKRKMAKNTEKMPPKLAKMPPNGPKIPPKWGKKHSNPINPLNR